MPRLPSRLEEPSRSGPSPLRRLGRALARRPLQLVAVALLALAVVAASAVPTGIAAALRQHVEPGWHGAYDLLVTATRPEPPTRAPDRDSSEAAGDDRAGAAPEPEPEPVAGLLPPNSTGVGAAPRLGLGDVDAIRAVAGVEVAAPISRISTTIGHFGAVPFAIPLDTETDEPTAESFRATLRYLGDDGLGPRLVSERVLDLAIDRTTSPLDRVMTPEELGEGWSCQIANGTSVRADDPRSLPCRTVQRQLVTISSGDPGGWYSFTAMRIDGYLVFDLDVAPSRPSIVTAVDPEAEAALLGEHGGFLDPLRDLPVGPRTAASLADWAAQREDARAESIGEYAEARAAELRAFAEQVEAAGQEFTPEFAAQFTPPLVPVLLAETAPPPLTVEIEVERFGTAEIHENAYAVDTVTLPSELESGEAGEALGSIEVDYGPLLSPFSEAAPRAWPGYGGGAPSAVPDRGRGVVYLQDPRTLRSALPVRDASGGLRLSPFGHSDGLTTFFGTAPAGAEPGMAVGSEAEFLDTVQSGSGFDGMIPELLPIADLSREQLIVEQGDDPVPLGGYDPAGAELVADAAGDPIEPVDLEPSLAGLGLVDGSTDVVADFADLVPFLGDRPVEAVRVRVAGVDGYSPGAAAKVAEVADRLEELGYRATPVAGSRAELLEFTVDDYAFGTLDAAEPQRLGELGTVRQRWFELGPAAGGTAGPSALAVTAVVVGLLATAALLALVQLAGLPRRRREATMLRALGWSRRRIATRLATGQLGVVLAIVVGSELAIGAAADRGFATIAAGLAVGAAIAIGVVVTAAALLPGRGRSANAVESGASPAARPDPAGAPATAPAPGPNGAAAPADGEVSTADGRGTADAAPRDDPRARATTRVASDGDPYAAFRPPVDRARLGEDVVGSSGADEITTTTPGADEITTTTPGAVPTIEAVAADPYAAFRPPASAPPVELAIDAEVVDHEIGTPGTGPASAPAGSGAEQDQTRPRPAPDLAATRAADSPHPGTPPAAEGVAASAGRADPALAGLGRAAPGQTGPGRIGTDETVTMPDRHAMRTRIRGALLGRRLPPAPLRRAGRVIAWASLALAAVLALVLVADEIRAAGGVDPAEFAADAVFLSGMGSAALAFAAGLIGVVVFRRAGRAPRRAR